MLVNLERRQEQKNLKNEEFLDSDLVYVGYINTNSDF